MDSVEFYRIEANDSRLTQTQHNKKLYLLSDSLCPSDQYVDRKKQFIEMFHQEIERNYKNSRIKIHDIADNLNMTERQLYRKSKEFINITPSNYLKAFRLDQAAELVIKGILIYMVSIYVGFSSHSYFSRCFKLRYGEVPSKYLEVMNIIPGISETLLCESNRACK